MDCHVLRGLGKFVRHVVHLLLPPQVRLLIDVRVAVVLNDVGVLNGVGRGDPVLSDRVFFIRVEV